MELKLSKISWIFLTFILVLGTLGLTQSTVAAEESNFGELSVINESTLHLEINKDFDFNSNQNGVGGTITSEGQTENLPEITVDKDGNNVNLVYKQVDDGLEIQVLNQIQPFGWVQCTLGTVGGTGTGGLSGAGVGSAVPAIGTVVGGVSGAAASCFN